MSDWRDRGLHSSYYGGAGYGGGYGGYPTQAGGYPPVAYPPPSGYPAYHHSGGGLAGAVAGYGATGHMMPPHGHGHTHGGYVGHSGGHGYGYGAHHHGKFKHGKFGNQGGFNKWK